MITPRIESHAILTARLAAGLTQPQAAAILGRSTRWWQNIEHGKVEVNPIIWAEWKRKVKRVQRKKTHQESTS